MNRNRIVLKQLRDAMAEKSNRVIYLLDSASEMVIIVTNLGGEFAQCGEYLYKIEFPEEYPFAAPRIDCLTPNGVFKLGTISCELGEMITVSSISAAIVSGMIEWAANPNGERLATSCEEKLHLAKQSATFNAANHGDLVARAYSAYLAPTYPKNPELLELVKSRAVYIDDSRKT